MAAPRTTVAETPPRARRRGGQPITTEVFLERATRQHGDRYDYSRVRYLGYRIPVDIVCFDHGVFSQTPNNHLHGGAGCPACGRRKQVAAVTRYDTGGFLARARDVHGDLYDYSQSAYEGLNAKLTIICRQHGPFRQTPNNHLHGRVGCPACAVQVIRSKTTLSQADFEAAVRRVHGDRYGLERARYDGATRKVMLTCSRHGAFSIAPNALLRGKGCRSCGYEKRQRTRDEFVNEAIEVFEERYTYRQVRCDLVPVRLQVAITCAQHGDFTMPAGRHLLGAGCPACSESRAEREIRRLLTDAGVAFVAQWGHPTLRRTLPLRFDFMLPELGVLIEFDGEFHHGPVRIAGTSPDRAEAVYRDTVARDAVKTEWAAAYGWALVRLSDRAAIARDLARAGVLSAPAPEVSDQ